jgi:hypothetical protein
MKNYLNTALQYHASGLRCIPVMADKRPALSGWKKYQEEQTEADIRDIFARDCHGIAILTGVNGLEVIDIDCKYDRTGRLAARFLLTAESFNDMKVPIAGMVIAGNGIQRLPPLLPMPQSRREQETCVTASI